MHAKNYGGVLTISVIAYELKTQLEVAKKSLERFVRAGEAQKIIKGNFSMYDFQSARTHLLKNDNRIITALRDNFKGLFRHELLQMTGLTLEPMEESLKRLESSGIVLYDELSDRVKLRGVTK